MIDSAESMLMNKKLILLLSCLLSLLLVGCSTFFKPLASSKAETGFHSQVIDDLMALPPPANKMVIAVYKFRDQTGQYKQSATSAITYSTAVTQGATSMLMKALEEAGQGKWFEVVERESLPSLLNERKIIRQTRMQYMSKEELEKIPALPAMLYAPVIFDGGVVAYESNLLTGGLGAKYLGIGGDTQFQRDNVTVALRAIAVNDGRILKSVQTSKTIFSVKLDSSLYRFVGWQNLLELEAGLSSNEPPQMAVLEAIQQAVYSMIMEGAIKGIWQFQDPVLGQQLIKKYQDALQVKAVPIYNGYGELEGFKKADKQTDARAKATEH
jgi:curli production assembly/transport component CsgG